MAAIYQLGKLFWQSKCSDSFKLIKMAKGVRDVRYAILRGAVRDEEEGSVLQMEPSLVIRHKSPSGYLSDVYCSQFLFDMTQFNDVIMSFLIDISLSGSASTLGP